MGRQSIAACTARLPTALPQGFDLGQVPHDAACALSSDAADRSVLQQVSAKV